MDPIIVKIGGQDIVLPPIGNFAQMERIWPAMLAMDEAKVDPVKAPVARLALIAGVLVETQPELSLQVLKQRLRINLFDGTGETTGLYDPVWKFLVASGLVADGRAKPEAPGGAAEPEPGTPIVVKIGGEAITLPPIGNLDQMERIWPAMLAMDDAGGDLVRETAARLALIAGVLVETQPELTLPALKQRLRINLFDGTGEIPGLIAPVRRFLEASGLVASGEVKPPEIPAAPAAPAEQAFPEESLRTGDTSLQS